MSGNVLTLQAVDTNKAEVENVVATLADASERAKEVGYPKALVILLDDRGGAYDITWRNAGMRMSECIAVMRVMEHKLIAEMEVG